MSNRNSCHHCEGKGYIEIRDCSGEIQREETCSFCGGTGYIQQKDNDESDRRGEVLSIGKTKYRLPESSC